MIRPTQLSYCRILENSRPEYLSVEQPTVAPVASGVIRIEIGRVRVRIEGAVDPATLRTILEQLGR